MLILEALEPLVVQVGQLGQIELPPGRYAYVGSALVRLPAGFDWETWDTHDNR